MPSITLTDPLTGTTVATGLIATNNSNLRALLNSGLDPVNFKGNPALVAGDVPVWDGANFVKPTGTPSATTFLRGDKSWASAPSSMTQIFDTTLGVAGIIDSNTVLGGNIPQTFNHLKIVLNSRDNTTASNAVNLSCRINNDSGGTQYSYSYSYESGTTQTIGDMSSSSSAFFGHIPGTTASAGMAGSAEILIADYRSTTFSKRWQSLFSVTASSSAGGGINGRTQGFWNNSAAITRIAFLNTFAVGTRMTLYGLT